MKLNKREAATVLAALRHLQESSLDSDHLEDMLRRGFTSHFEDCDPLTLEGIDDLCERINCNDDAPEPCPEHTDADCDICKECGTCGDVSSEVQSTYCGSQCPDCLNKHVQECGPCRKDFVTIIEGEDEDERE